jgi:hypothetical protein
MHSQRGAGILKAKASLILLWTARSEGVISSFRKLVSTQWMHSWEMRSRARLRKLNVFIEAKFLLV